MEKNYLRNLFVKTLLTTVPLTLVYNYFFGFQVVALTVFMSALGAIMGAFLFNLLENPNGEPKLTSSTNFAIMYPLIITIGVFFSLL